MKLESSNITSSPEGMAEAIEPYVGNEWTPVHEACKLAGFDQWAMDSDASNAFEAKMLQLGCEVKRGDGNNSFWQVRRKK
jgi:hypothetical protein